MYLVARPPGDSLDAELIDLVGVIQYAIYWIWVHFNDFIMPHLRDFWEWLTWQNFLQGLRLIFEHPSEWPAHAFHAAQWLFVTHTHVVSIVSLSIFFGPIGVLIPLLLLHEFIVSLLYNLSFIFHGLLGGPADDRYLYFHSLFDDLKGSIFSSVDRLGAKYNNLTTEYWPLVIFRLLCLGLGGLALYRITSENQRQSLPTAF